MAEQVVEKIAKVGIVGCGTMGSGIAEIVARKGVPVAYVEVDGEAVARGRDTIEHSLDGQVRRERIEAAGWTVIVVTAADLASPTSVVARVFQALVRRGYTGPPPVLGDAWRRVAGG